MSGFVFLVFGALAVAGAVALVVSPRPWLGLLGLLTCCLALGAIFVGLDAVFLGAVQILVSTGIVATLWSFVVQLGEGRDGRPSAGRHPYTKAFITLSAMALGAVAAFTLWSSRGEAWLPEGPAALPRGFGGVERVAAALLGNYAVALELLGLILLAAWVGSLVLAQRSES